jgi:hypothetical protein
MGDNNGTKTIVKFVKKALRPEWIVSRPKTWNKWEK